MFDYLIVGAGISGCTLAERIASQLDKKVLIVDRRPHIGGFTYDYYNADGILVHKYGNHTFHTNSKEVFNYLSHFTEWYDFSPKIRSFVDGMFLPFPINKDTLNQLYDLKLNSDTEVQNYLDSVKEPIPNPRNAEEMILSQVGRDLYEKFFYHYTVKYWGREPKELDKNLTVKIAPRTNNEYRYKVTTYQTMPNYGFTAMFKKILSHPNIEILLETDYRSILEMINYDKLIFTGSIDEYFDCMYGVLPYRSLRFEMETFEREYYQPYFIVHYPNDYKFKSIAEFKHATGQKHAKTTIVRDYPMEAQPGMELCYPLPCLQNRELFKLYLKEAKKLKTVFFCGRLASYTYTSIGESVAQALMMFKTAIAPNL